MLTGDCNTLLVYCQSGACLAWKSESVLPMEVHPRQYSSIFLLLLVFRTVQIYPWLAEHMDPTHNNSSLLFQ